MLLHLVRHADAGNRQAWEGPDELRPLNERGRAQAAGLVAQLACAPVARVTTSPALRCVQTVEPLALARRLAVVEEPLLMEGTDARRALAWLSAEAAHGPLVACSHGDLIPALLDLCLDDGLQITGRQGGKKGSTWVLEGEAGRFLRARWLPPSA